MKKIIQFIKNAPGGTSKKLIATISGLIVSVSVLITSVFSFAWFAHNSQTSSSGMQVAVDAGGFEILVTRSAAVYNNISSFQTHLSGEGYDFSSSMTGAGRTGVALELNNELISQGEEGRHLRPGAYGTLTFYIYPKAQTQAKYVFNLKTAGFKKNTVVDEGGNIVSETVVRIVKDDGNASYDEVVDLLNGHLLFFMAKNGGKYDDFLDDGYFEIDTSDAGVTPITVDEKSVYMVTLYWVWPLTYNDMSDASRYSAGAISDLAGYINENPTYFFPESSASSDNGGKYNDGDQAIGDIVDFIALLLTVSEE